MSSRGRGYPRSSRGGGYFRGNSNSYRGNSRSSNAYAMSRGGSSRYNAAYDSRSSNSRYLASDERFPSNRNSDGYKRVTEYRGGSSRDRTPERKRSRYEQGSSRSHEYGNSSGDYSSSRNYESTYEHKRDHRISRTQHSPQTTNARSTFRTRPISTSSRRSQERMGPPKRIPPRSRGVSYRGRLSSRGLRTSRVLIRRTDLRTIQRKRTTIPSTKSREYLRSLKLARLRSSIKKKRSLERHSSEERKERKRDAGEEDKEDRSSGKDGEKKKSIASSKKKETGEANEKEEHKSGDDSTEKTTTATIKKSNAKSVSVKKEKEAASGNEDEKANKDEASGDDSNNEVPSDDEKLEKKSKSDSKDFSSSKNYYGKSFIKLTCVHCFAKCRTFKEYSQHLHERSHKLVMSKLYMKQKTKLSRMRQQQRNSQREIDEKGDNKSRPQFCPLCRLNYRQAKVKHQLSVGHRSMKKFLMPHCRICNITFKGPMIYEAHRCSLEHIKKKASSENHRRNQDSGDDDKVLDLNNFMTVDSVGDVDGNDDNDEANEDPNEKKEEINVGSEHVKKVEAYYCDLCRYHLPQQEDFQTALHRHCSSNNHLRSYLQYREDKQLRKAAEKAHRKHQESKDNKEKEKTEAKVAIVKPETVPAEESETDDVEEKMWASVDQDLGDLLREVGPENGNANNDDDEDEGSTANAERYDRFKNSEVAKTKSDEEIKADITEVIDEPPKEKRSEKADALESKE